MKELLQKLLIGHAHRWEERSAHEVIKHGDRVPINILIVLRCSVCGCLKTHKIVA